jgi:hypothetical protein
MSHVRPVRNTAHTSTVAAAILATAVVPDGWARTTAGAATVFTDRSDVVRIETNARTAAATDARQWQ